MIEDYKKIAAAKRQQRLDAIPKEWLIEIPDEDNLLSLPETCGVLSEKELEITGKYDAVGLLEKVHAGELSAYEVTLAFCKRAAIAQQATNCLTEIFFDKGLERAKELDAIFAKTGKPVGPLHGLPISVKDSMNIKGIDSSIGMASNSFKPEKESSAIVVMLESLGGIMYVKTNVPQSMMVLDTQNNIFGRVRNPYSKHITSAGSSGGAGAIVAFRGSLIGMATDIGGSIRVPAYANGVTGIKPSSGRMPYHNLKGYWPEGEEYCGVLCVEGPITVSRRDAELIVRSVVQTEPWINDPTCVYSPWPTLPALDRPLRIGVVSSKTYEPVTSIFARFVEKVRAAGHELIDIELINANALCDNASDFYKIDGGEFLVSECERFGEPLTEAVRDAGLYPCTPGTLKDFFKNQYERVEYQRAWLKYWAETAGKTKDGEPIDIVLSPTMPALPRPTEPIGDNANILAYNVLDAPAATFPVETIEDPAAYTFEFPAPTNEIEQKIESQFAVDRGVPYKGFSVGVQIISPRLTEAKLFQAWEILEKVL
ncbi:amidase signature domain-containing protein [Dipodascopsis tothii]|uniref:amidase signature domain-containing protein n=1 Tax=Dipodascopsis tothii TaxID=44089 RepID=UPI0034CEB852